MMSNSDKSRDFSSSFDDQKGESKLLRKAKENPFVPAGIAGAVGALIYSAYKFKNRGDQKLSVYLIHTRVAAQGAIVSALTIGVAIQMYREWFLGDTPEGIRKKHKSDPLRKSHDSSRKV